MPSPEEQKKGNMKKKRTKLYKYQKEIALALSLLYKNREVIQFNYYIHMGYGRTYILEETNRLCQQQKNKRKQ